MYQTVAIFALYWTEIADMLAYDVKTKLHSGV